MYQMPYSTEVIVTTGADGNCWIAVCPLSPFAGAKGVNPSQLPFVFNSTAVGNNPYGSLGAYVSPSGPLNGQTNNVINFGIDKCQVKFI